MVAERCVSKSGAVCADPHHTRRYGSSPAAHRLVVPALSFPSDRQPSLYHRSRLTSFCVSMWATPLRCPACPQRCRGSNPGAPATQSDLPLTFLRYPENRAVARYFAGEEPVSTDGFGGFNGLRGQAEQAARDLLVRFPDVHDGYDRLGMVYEARGDNRQAADCYRKVIAFIREHPDDYEPGFEDVFVKLVNRLDPPAAT